MNKHGRYYELFSTQAKRYLTEVDENDTLPEDGGHEPPKERRRRMMPNPAGAE